jgi:ferric-dicitrate binding protein FerR (iron transport regulator)
MSLPKERIAYLLQTYTSKKATVQEEQELMEWMHEAQEDSELKAYVETLWEQSGTDFSYVNWDNMYDNIIHSEQFAMTPEPKPKPVRWINYRWVAAAAAILVLFASGTYLLLAPARQNQPVANHDYQPAKDVAPPATNKAFLTLANGKIIILDNASMGSLATKGATNATKTNDGELVYTARTETAVEYHTLNVPKGSKPMQLQLADGSEVWLNAASSITFPNVFAGAERRVTVTGEAYFEVTKNAGKKFIVEANGTTTEVLGTHFNINAYKDEPVVRVTLLEGSVKVSRKSAVSSWQSALLKPGQQAVVNEGLTPNTQHLTLNTPDLNQVMAWKNGMFEFNETDVQTIMRQIERWYDVEVVFDDKVTQHFNGSIQRQVNASKVLDMLEKTGGARFSIEGKKVVVKKY